MVKYDLDSGISTDVTPAEASGFNVRTRVHEYGGGASLVAPGGGTIYFVNFSDQRLYRQDIGAKPVALVAAETGLRFADMVLDTTRNRLVCVVEDHSTAAKEPVNYLASIPLGGPEGAAVPEKLTGGHDFYASPRVSPDGRQLAWIAWDHPSMPWDSTYLYTADFTADGNVANTQIIHGAEGDISVVQPLWSPIGGKLYFISDASSGWWNVWQCTPTPGAAAPAECACACLREGTEFAGPMWGLGASDYQCLPDGRLVCSFSNVSESGTRLGILDPTTGRLTPIETDYTHFGGVSISCPTPDTFQITAVVGSSVAPSAICVSPPLTPGDGKSPIQVPSDSWKVLKRSSTSEVDEAYLSVPQAIEYPTERGLTAWMIYYPPTSKDFQGPEGERPPLLVKTHGGPTGATSTAFNLSIQYWTSRGVAVADVNYGGSTGYGREYRDRLKGNWGIVDVEDSCNAARYLADIGKVDAKRCAISGGSAGGYTTLAALAFKDTFSAGASHYGVANLEMLAGDTHKFESRYLDSLVGPYPEEKMKYQERAPINSVDTITCPLAQFQGLEDKIVPPNQAEVMYAAVKSKGIPTTLVMFEGEQHGFRQAENIRRALDGEMYFYGKVFGFEAKMPDDFVPLEIENL